MSNFSQGPGWWQASDGKWYPPQPPTFPPVQPVTQAPVAPPTPVWGPPTYGMPPPSPGDYQVYGTPGVGGSGLPSVQGMAIASLVLGACGIVLCFCSGLFSVGLGMIGLPLGIIALKRINGGQADSAAKSTAIGGIVCSALALALGVLGIVFLVTTFRTGN